MMTTSSIPHTLFDVRDVFVAEHYMSALVNGDYTGLTDADEHMLDQWYAHATKPWTDSDGREWTFAHIGDIASDGDFTLDEVSDMYAPCSTVRLVFTARA